MAFPPAEENLDAPPELIGEGNLFGSEVVAIGGYPVINTRHPIADHADFFIRLIDARSSQQHDGVIKDDTSGLDVIHADDGLFRGGFDPADKMFSLRLPGIKQLMFLVASIHDARFPRSQNPGDERPFRLFAVGEE